MRLSSIWLKQMMWPILSKTHSAIAAKTSIGHTKKPDIANFVHSPIVPNAGLKPESFQRVNNSPGERFVRSVIVNSSSKN
jgi:hypothetical protein